MIMGPGMEQPQPPPAPVKRTAANPPPSVVAWPSAEDELGNQEAGGTAWLITFTDLVGLLLAMFIMLFAMSQLDSKRWQSLVDTFSTRPPQADGPRASKAASDRAVIPLVERPGENLDYLSNLLREQLADDPVLGAGLLQTLEDRVVLSFPGELLFAPGADEPEPAAQQALFRLGGLLRNLDNRVEIAGHADPSPAPAAFAGNWELSLARALAVARLLRAAGYAEAPLLRGHGDSRAGWISREQPEPRRLALARRVDLIIHRSRDGGP